MDQNQTNKTPKTIIGIIIGILVFYFAVEQGFRYSIECKNGVPSAVCECLKTKISKNTSFVDKISSLITGSTGEELASHINTLEALDCAVRDIDGFNFEDDDDLYY